MVTARTTRELESLNLPNIVQLLEYLILVFANNGWSLLTVTFRVNSIEIVDENTGALQISFGSSYKTSDFIADTLQEWWDILTLDRQKTIEKIQIKVDSGPESSGVRTQFLNRMVDFSDKIGKAINLIYYPLYHSKYNPIERCWGVLEKHWNGVKLLNVSTMLA